VYSVGALLSVFWLCNPSLPAQKRGNTSATWWFQFKVPPATRPYAHRLLQCLAVAVRPLRLEELAEILAFDFDDAPVGIPKLNVDWRREDQERSVLSTCSSLITIAQDGDSRVVHFSHFSVKEFLTSDRLAVAAEDISFYHIAPAPLIRYSRELV
jgi:hypothetical protein